MSKSSIEELKEEVGSAQMILFLIKNIQPISYIDNQIQV